MAHPVDTASRARELAGREWARSWRRRARADLSLAMARGGGGEWSGGRVQGAAGVGLIASPVGGSRGGRGGAPVAETARAAAWRRAGGRCDGGRWEVEDGPGWAGPSPWAGFSIFQIV